MTGKVSTCRWCGGGGYYNPPHSLAVVKYNSQTQLCPNKLNDVSLWHKVFKVMTVNGRRDTAGMSAECRGWLQVSRTRECGGGTAWRSMRQRLRAQGVGGAAVSGASRHHSVCVCVCMSVWWVLRLLLCHTFWAVDMSPSKAQHIYLAQHCDTYVI